MKKTLILFLLLGLFVVLVRLPSLGVFDKDSGAIAYHARQILEGQPLYSTHHPNHHLPGAFYTYAAIFALLGDQFTSVKITLVFWVWLNAWVIYLIGRKAGGDLGGMLASVFFVLATALPSLHGDTAEIEQFANLPLSLTILAAAHILTERKPARWYLLVGILGGISLLYKVTFVHALAAAGITLLVVTIRLRDRSAWAALYKAGSYALAGFAAPLAAVAAYFAAVGAWPGLMLVFQLGAGYVGRLDSPLYNILLFPLFLAARANLVLTILGLVGAVQVARKFGHAIEREPATGPVRLMLVVWLVTSVIVAGISRFPFVYYGLLVVPALSLLAGTEIGQLWERSRGERPLAWVAAVFAIAIIANGIFVSRQYLGAYLQYRLGNIPEKTFLQEGPTNGRAHLESLEIADYVRSRSAPDDLIFVWSDNVQIYYFSGRRTPAYLLWPHYLDETAITQALAKKPLYVIVAPKIVFNVPIDYLLREMSGGYALETVTGGHQVFRRTAP
ncbi:MAG: glycosyltransferase family 39 protein [Chloroflexota bacterium]